MRTDQYLHVCNENKRKRDKSLFVLRNGFENSLNLYEAV